MSHWYGCQHTVQDVHSLRMPAEQQVSCRSGNEGILLAINEGLVNEEMSYVAVDLFGPVWPDNSPKLLESGVVDVSRVESVFVLWALPLPPPCTICRLVEVLPMCGSQQQLATHSSSVVKAWLAAFGCTCRLHGWNAGDINHWY